MQKSQKLGSDLGTIFMAATLSMNDFGLKCATVLVCVFIVKSIYNVLFHPLRAFPDPWYARSSRIWYLMSYFGGYQRHRLKELHDSYGPVVRIAPNELSYYTPDAWGGIFGRGPSKTFKRDPLVFETVFADENIIADAQGETYKAQKRSLSYPYSHKYIVSCEEHINCYVDRFINELESVNNEKVDLTDRIANVVLDITGKLTFDHDFEATLDSPAPNPIYGIVCNMLSFLNFYLQFRRLPRIVTRLIDMTPQLAMSSGLFSECQVLSELIERRIRRGSDEKDIIFHMLKLFDVDKESDVDKVVKNTTFLTAASSDLSVWSSCSMIYHILSNKSALEKASFEVRDTFGSANNLTTNSVQQLAYLNACIDETFRMYHPLVTNITRQTPPSGAIICNNFVPGNMLVGMSHFGMYRSEENFKDAGEFVPERWLMSSNSRYKDDKREVFHPFSAGPRPCIGRN